MSHLTIHEHAERIREHYRKKAYKLECRSGIALPAIRTASTLAESISRLSDIQGEEAEAAAKEIYASSESLQALKDVLFDVPDPVLNYLYSSVCYRYFSKKYFPIQVERNFSPLYHDEYFMILREVETHHTITPTMVCGPRGWGKSTLGGIIMPIHAIVFPVEIIIPNGKTKDISKRYVQFVSADQKSSKRTMGSVLAELEDNQGIRSDFGEFYKEEDARVKRRKDWSKEVAVTNNDKRLEAHTRKTKIKGSLYRGFRPDLQVLDDLEDDENIDNVNLRDRDFLWLQKVVIPSRNQDTGNQIVLGNMDIQDGLYQRIYNFAKGKSWNIRVFKVFEIDPETNRKIYTWPEYYGPAWEAEEIAMVGAEAYELEYQQNPQAAKREIAKDEFHYYELSDIRDRLNDMWLIGACDQASGKKKARHDETAIGGIAYDKKARLTYVLPFVVGKTKKSEQAQAVLDYHQEWDFLEFWIEATSDQGSLVVSVKEQAREDDVEIPVDEIHSHTVGKHDRIRNRLFNRCRHGRILFIKGDKSHEKLIDGLVRLGEPGVKDDAPDCLEMAVRKKDEKLFGKKKPKDEGGTVFAQTVVIGGQKNEEKNIPTANRPRLISIGPRGPRYSED